jgi:hypothetical protein
VTTTVVFFAFSLAANSCLTLEAMASVHFVDCCRIFQPCGGLLRETARTMVNSTVIRPKALSSTRRAYAWFFQIKIWTHSTG